MNFKQLTVGIVAILFGLLKYIPQNVVFQTIQQYTPVVLIVLGVIIILDFLADYYS